MYFIQLTKLINNLSIVSFVWNELKLLDVCKKRKEKKRKRWDNFNKPQNWCNTPLLFPKMLSPYKHLSFLNSVSTTDCFFLTSQQMSTLPPLYLIEYICIIYSGLPLIYAEPSFHFLGWMFPRRLIKLVVPPQSNHSGIFLVLFQWLSCNLDLMGVIFPLQREPA